MVAERSVHSGLQEGRVGTGAVSGRRTQPESRRVREHHCEAGRKNTDDSRECPDFSHLWIHTPERLQGPGPWLEVTCINSCNPHARRRPLWRPSLHSNETLAHRGSVWSDATQSGSEATETQQPGPGATRLLLSHRPPQDHARGALPT